MDEAAKIEGAGRVGARLAAERIAQGLSIEDIVARTRVPRRSVELIEAGASEGLPALTYSAGFVRSYARAVGLDGDAYALAFRGEMGQPVQRAVAEPFEPADPARVPTRLLAIVALLLAVMVAGGYALWRGDRLFGGGAEDRSRLAAGTDPALQPPPEVTTPAPRPAVPAPAAGGPVTVTAREEAWVRIADGDAPSLFMGIMKPGQVFTVPATAVAPVIRTSRAQVLDVKVGGVAMPPLGPPDTLLRAASLKRDALLAAPALVPPRATP